ncbi:hypothetical protein [Cronobacter malonaticus]|uniref:hypothetical protein n=1 Tax=Cronobacter malonaticus TaxID=413503 RepID=UPI001F1DAF17|nr:hypothetical protein [Cronobacter malonaticus]
MDERNLAACASMSKSPSWGVTDIFKWKLLPAKFGGGIRYIQKFKDSWVIHNKIIIRMSATQYHLPAEFLAGVCWIEVGGDPNFIDRVAFEVRTFDLSGPDIFDRYLTTTSPPEKTSFGFVSIQLRTAAKTMGIDSSSMSTTQWRQLSNCLEKDAYNINLVARHLRQLADYDKFTQTLKKEDIRIVGTRYNRGVVPTLDEIKRNTRYGDFILKNWQRFHWLIWD